MSKIKISIMDKNTKERIIQENNELKAKLEKADEMNKQMLAFLLEANQTIRYYEKMQKVTRYKAPWEK